MNKTTRFCGDNTGAPPPNIMVGNTSQLVKHRICHLIFIMRGLFKNLFAPPHYKKKKIFDRLKANYGAINRITDNGCRIFHTR